MSEQKRTGKPKRIPYGMMNFEQAKAQVNRYADLEIVRSSVKHTQLHKVVVLYRSIDMVRCEEVF